MTTWEVDECSMRHTTREATSKLSGFLGSVSGAPPDVRIACRVAKTFTFHAGYATGCDKAEKAAFRQPDTEKNLQIPLPRTVPSCTMTSVL
jgi:hypothetical protein